MNMNELVIVEGDDWEGIYGDGKLIGEGHSFSAHRLGKLLGGAPVCIVRNIYIGNAYEDVGRLPQLLADVVASDDVVEYAS